MLLTDRFDQALRYSSRLHQRQARKGTTIPYIAHLLSVAALVLEAGGDEDAAIAALLHDAVEDQGGLRTLEEIRQRFGERVAEIVAACSDAVEEPKPPWRERKTAYLAHLEQAAPEVLLVSLADKLHNARTILADLRQGGEWIWTRFHGGKDGTLWYYHSLLAVFIRRTDSPMVAELERVLRRIGVLVNPSTGYDLPGENSG